MAIQSPQIILDQLYAARLDLIAGKLASYSIGDRSLTLNNLHEIEDMIRLYEQMVMASTPLVIDMGGPVGARWTNRWNE